MSQLKIDEYSVEGIGAIPSAATIDLENATGDLLDISGTTTITRIILYSGHQRTVRFTGALTLTHSSTLVLPGQANITTVVGDIAIFRGYVDGTVRCVSYSPISGLQDTLVSGTNIKTVNGASIVGGGDLAVSGGIQITTTTVQTDVATKQDLLTAVPTGKSRVIMAVVCRNASADLTTQGDSTNFGFGGGDDYYTSNIPLMIVFSPTYAAIIALSLNVLAVGSANGTFMGFAGDVFGMYFNDPSIVGTLDIDVHYYDVDA